MGVYIKVGAVGISKAITFLSYTFPVLFNYSPTINIIYKSHGQSCAESPSKSLVNSLDHLCEFLAAFSVLGNQNLKRTQIWLPRITTLAICQSLMRNEPNMSSVKKERYSKQSLKFIILNCVTTCWEDSGKRKVLTWGLEANCSQKAP